jgi:hypothetical protein
LPRVLRGVLERGEQGDETEAVDGLYPGLEKTWVKKNKKKQPNGFFCFLGVFWVFFIYLPGREEFLGFFQFQEYF